MDLYVISGVTGMTGNELSRKLVAGGHRVIGFDNFFASSITTVEDILENQRFSFYEFDINNREQMEMLRDMVREETEMGRFDRVVYINCAAVVHTEHFYHVNRTFETNVLGMKAFLEQAEAVGADTFINCSTSEVYSMNSWGEHGVAESAMEDWAKRLDIFLMADDREILTNAGTITAESSIFLAISLIISGSTPNSCRERGRSFSWAVSNISVFLLL